MDFIRVQNTPYFSDFGPVKLLGLSRNGPLGRVVGRAVDNVIHWINRYPADSAVCFVNTYPLDSDLSDGYSYLAFEQQTT